MPDHPEKPFPRSYWVVPHKLLAGSYPGSRDQSEALEKLEGLIRCGVGHVINLMEADEKDRSGEDFITYEGTLTNLAKGIGVEVNCKRHPIRDGEVPSTEMMIAILHDIDAAISQGRPVYVHCWGGVGRTGTVVGCYLARHGLATGQDCLDRIRQLRRNDPTVHRSSPETEEQRQLLLSWQRGQ